MTNADDKAWDYHKAADELLHNRVESFFMAQAFLIAAFVYLVVEGQPPDEQTYPLHLARLGAAIVLLGITVTCAILWLNGLLIGRISFLKRHYLSKEPVYADYMRGRLKGEKEDRDGVKTEGLSRFILPIVIPFLFLAFWGFCVCWGFHFLEPGAWRGFFNF